MKSWKQPTPEQVNKAVAQLAHGEHYRYFFDRLGNPEWLLPLKEKGYFKSPPAPIPDDSGRASLPVWPESRYLARMAKLAPETVAEILASIPETENVCVQDDFVEALLAMPAKFAAKFVPDVLGWTQGRFELLIPEKFGALVSHLATGGEIAPALQLAKSVLALQADSRQKEKATEENRLLRPEPQPFFNAWHYEKLLENEIPNLVAAAPAQTLTLLCDLLDQAVHLSQRDEEKHEPDDYSYIWRPGIEQPRHVVDNICGMLVSAVRAAAEQSARQDMAHLPEIISELENRRWRIFHRIALHLLRLFSNIVPDLAKARLTEPERFDRSDYRREYNLLAKECFARLEVSDQTKILEWIEKGPNIEIYKTGWQKFHNTPPTEGKISAYSKMWQRDRLAPLSANLPEEWKRRYRQLVDEFGPAEEPQTTSDPKWGWETPKTTEELGALSIEELIDYLRSWAPAGTRSPLDASVQGLAQALGALVVSQPERFSSEAERFVGLDPTYVRALLQGLWESAAQKRPLDWGKILALCRWVVEQPLSIPGRRGRITEQDPDWGWTRRAIVKLFLDGLNSDAVPFENRSQAWQILETLSDDHDPAPEDESENKSTWRDPAEYSINTTRGEAMHAVMSYALWVGRHLSQELGFGNDAVRSFDQMPEVRTVLDKHLQPNIEPSLAIRSVYGQWFPSLVFLDRSWARESVPKIFPSEQASKELRDAAWNTYVVYNAPYDDVFEILRGQYLLGIEQIEVPAGESAKRKPADINLAQHLMTEYWRGNLVAEDSDGMLARFYAKADPKLRHQALTFIGRSLSNTRETIPTEIIQRLQKLWAWRLQAVRAAGASSPEMEELTSFGWWFSSGKLPDQWSIEELKEVLKLTGRIELEQPVVERLAQLAQSEPAKAVECLALIIDGDKNGWGVLSWLDHARTLLGLAIHSVDQAARTRAIGLVHRLGERGYPQFRDLLQ